MARERVLITGAHGYLASLAQLYNAGTYDFIRVSHSDVDFADPERVAERFRKADFDICLHMAADATTAHCEKDSEGTHRVNTESAIEIARVCQERGKRLVFISTEQCFNAAPGQAPYCETDEMGTVSRYGQQKAEADLWIQEHLEDYVILRFSWMFGLALPGVHPSPNILTNVMRALRTDTTTGFRVHERRNMTYAQRFAGQLPKILALPSGVYHLASQNPYTTYEAAQVIAARLGCDSRITERIILPDGKTYAEAPRDFRLASDKIQAAGIELGTFEEDLDLCLRDFGLA